MRALGTKLMACAMIIAIVMLWVPTLAVSASNNLGPVGPFIWNTQFFNNATLSGTAIITRLDASVGGNWGTGSPGLGIPSNYFSARWSTTAYLPRGGYRMTFVADDCVRVYLDNQLVLNTFDQPRPGQTLTYQHTTTSAGNHSIRIEYRENTNSAYLSFVWEQISTAPVATPTPVPSGPPVGWVNTNGLNVHAGPDYSYDVVVLAFKNWTMTLLGRNTNSSWLKVQTYDGKTGWVEVAHITTHYLISSLPVVDGTQRSISQTSTRPTTTTQVRQHVIQPGECLSRIAIQYGVNVYTLARFNGISNLNLIYAGQVLMIP